MPNNKLNINFTEKALKYINAESGSLKITKANTYDYKYSVVWISTLPFECNKIEWPENSVLYAFEQEAGRYVDIRDPPDTIVGKEPAYEFSSEVFQNARNVRSVGCNENIAKNAIDQYRSLSAELSQNPEEVNDEE